ncbi:keratin, type I cytoskeletal 10-like [Ostrea edulis]|uniref:keratin, type I cytoskeletal 10-like n=1 Tax=Ostrea edulis TaxID=37623 RepID=UPI0024AEED64|nr:keratin, type I cytoskeletal 10-like [Ostrea edulis]
MNRKSSFLCFTLLTYVVVKTFTNQLVGASTDGSGNGGSTDGSGNGGSSDGSGNGGSTDGSGNGGSTDGSGNGGSTDGSGNSGSTDGSGSSSSTDGPGGSIEELCDCDCDYMDKIENFKNTYNPNVNKTTQELVKMLKEDLKKVKKALELQKKDIPAVKAQKISAPDVRPSAKYIGLIGVVSMVIVFGGIVVLDLISLPRYIRSLKENLC